MSDELRMVFEANPALSDEEYVHRQLGIWNMKVTGFTDYYPANFFLRDGEHRVRGALLAYVWGKWLHVETFWIEDNLRGQGWGKKMLEAAHEIGRQKGAEAAWLNTFSWQARSLYERFGYEAVFEVADFPPGHSRIYMRKQPL
jgi:ribosomal protein S18 acetylase RimI-like enzyme